LPIDPGFHLCQRRRQLACQLVEAEVHLGLEGGKSGLGAFHALLRGVGHRERHLRQALGLLPELANRLLLHLFEGVPLALDGGLELMQPIGGLLADAGAGVFPLACVGFELRDRVGMTLDGGGPAFQVFGVLVGHHREPLLDWRHVGFGLAPETFDLRLEVGEALLEFREFQHDCLSRMIHKRTQVAARQATISLASRASSRYDFATATTTLTHTCEVQQ
jgi:hypothetical protein